MIDDSVSEKTPEPQEREARVTVHLLFSALLFVVGVFIVPTTSFLIWLFSGPLYVVFPVITALLVVLLVCGILEIVGAVGLFRLKPWARTIAVWTVFIAFLTYVGLVANITAFGATYGVGLEDIPFYLGLSFALLFGPILIHLTMFAYFFTKEARKTYAPRVEE